MLPKCPSHTEPQWTCSLSFVKQVFYKLLHKPVNFLPKIKYWWEKAQKFRRSLAPNAVIQAYFQEQSLLKCWTLLHGCGVTIVNKGKLTMSGACYWCMLISSSGGAGKTICILVSKETKTFPWYMILVSVPSALSLQGLDLTISKMRPYALWKWRFLTIEPKTSSTSALCFQKHDLAKLYFHFYH